MRSTILALALVCVLCVLCAGCVMLQDAIASMIGAPTSKDVAAEQERLVAADKEVRTLEGDLRRAEKLAGKHDQGVQIAQEKKLQIRQLYAQMAQQLGQAEGPGADVMLGTLENLQRQLRTAGDQGDRLAAIAAGYRAQADTIAGAIGEAEEIIFDAEANLLGFADQQEAAIAGVMGTVGLAGEAAAALGVPGGKAAVAMFGGIVQGGLNVLLGGGAIAGATVARRRRKQRDEESGRRRNLARAVQASDKFGLIVEDEKLRAGAKDWGGPAAHLELKRARIEDLESAPS
ncbi:MAG: hypothetical protein V3U03_17365 [Myxococcota bacterium]